MCLKYHCLIYAFCFYMFGKRAAFSIGTIFWNIMVIFCAQSSGASQESEHCNGGAFSRCCVVWKCVILSKWVESVRKMALYRSR